MMTVIFSGCQKCETDQMQLDERNHIEEEAYWMVAVEDYVISLKDLVPEKSLKLVYCQDDSETIIGTLQKGRDYEDVTEVMAEPFENLLGHNGFCLKLANSCYMNWNYYNVVEEGKMECLADSWGTDDRPSEDFMVDIDEDGELELICNVTFGADGAARTYIYDYQEGQVWMGEGEELLDEPYDDWGVNSLALEYLPEEGIIRICFWKDVLNDYEAKDYKLDLDKMEMWPYEVTVRFE